MPRAMPITTAPAATIRGSSIAAEASSMPSAEKLAGRCTKAAIVHSTAETIAESRKERRMVVSALWPFFGVVR